MPKKNKVESGIIHYQKEHNYLTSVVYKVGKKFFLEQMLKEKDKNVTSLKKVHLKKYSGSIIFKTQSREDRYTFYYSLDIVTNIQFIIHYEYHMRKFKF